ISGEPMKFPPSAATTTQEVRRGQESETLEYSRALRLVLRIRTCLGIVQKQVTDRWRISNRTTLTMTRSRPTGCLFSPVETLRCIGPRTVRVRSGLSGAQTADFS